MNIITGMHRSGTSLIARLFYEAGANMGDPNRFYRPDKWNPDGYYEQPDIQNINMQLINGPLWKFSYFWLPSTQRILKRSRKLNTTIQSVAQTYETAIVKETRFCLTLPAWLEYGTKVDRILVCLREPLQVARSIQKRNRTLISHGLWLWYVHNTRLLENVPADVPVWYMNYHKLLNQDSYVDELSKAFEFMGIHLSEARILELLRAYVKPDMNHHKGSISTYPAHIDQLWKALQEKHDAQSKP